MAATPNARAPEPVRGTGWSEPAPLAPPPGVALCDAMMDAADARDRAARIVDAAMARRGAVAERPTETTPAGSPVQATENANRAPSKIPAGSKT